MTDPRARFVAGLLSARDELTADTDASRVADDLGPATLWITERLDDDAAVAWRDKASRSAPAWWVRPDDDLVAGLEATLVAGWEGIVARLRSMDGDVPPVLRVMCRDAHDVAALRSLVTQPFGPPALDGLAVTWFRPTSIGDWVWRWPMRVGIVDGPDAEGRATALRGHGGFADQYEVVVIDPHLGGSDPGNVELLVLRPTDVPPRLRCGAVIVAGEPTADQLDAHDADRHRARHELARSVSAGASVSVDDGSALMAIEELVRELSHDRPLDAAVATTMPDADVVGHPDFFSLSAIRQWCGRAASEAENRGLTELAERLRAVARDEVFDSERHGGRTTAAIMAAAISRGHDLDVLDGPARHAARPLESGDGSGDGGGAMGPLRSLTVDVRGPGSAVLVNGFVRGATHRLTFRIAATPRPGETIADAPLPSPDPDHDVTLDVTVVVAGSRGRPSTTTVTHPATGDGAPSEPIAFRAPRRAGVLQLYVTVAHRGRALQSAVLSGPLLDAVTTATAPPTAPPTATATTDTASGGFRFDVDRSGRVDPTVSESAPAARAGASLVEVPGTRGVPAIFDAAHRVPIDAATTERALAGVRRSLVRAFRRPPTDLASANAVLADLAVRGSVLRDTLRGKDDGFYDDVDWVHVVSFASHTLPFELIYTHAMPDQSGPVEVCAPALAGTDGCDAGCPERDRTDRVCPFGFWATTKVVERRLHTSGRDDDSVGTQRTLRLRRGAVSAVTPQANADDPNASARIAAAVARFADAGTAIDVPSWSELETALAAPRTVLCLVTHTELGDPDDDLAAELVLGSESKRLISIGERHVNPSRMTPGPVVLSLGCETGAVAASFGTLTSRLHAAGAEIVVAAVSQIPGREVADFVERLFAVLDAELSHGGTRRFGELLTRARRATLRTGDVLALALFATGDGDVQVGS
jgi:hypothetical protein